MAQKAEESHVNWIAITIGFYITGMLFFLGRFLNELRGLNNMLKKQPFLKRNGFKYIDTPAVNSPFSFFNYIVYNSKILSETELENILQHEKAHSSQKHSLDMVISQLFCVFFWFNPFIWLYKKAITQNLEFIADSEACKQVSDITAYQKTLLKITVQPKEGNTAIINQFYQSLIKKRIVMLNAKQSRLLNKWKYATVLPILAIFIFAFQLKVQAQEKQKNETENLYKADNFKAELLISKDSKKEDLEREKDFFKKEFDVQLRFSGIRYNANDELTSIKVKAKGNGVKKEFSINGTEPIHPFTIVVEKDSNKELFLTFLENIPTPPAPPVPPTTPISPTPPKVGFWSVNNVQINNKDLLIVIDGKRQEKRETIEIPVNRSIDEIKTLDKKEAKKKYGSDGKKGAIEITTKENTDPKTGIIIKSDLKTTKGKGITIIDEEEFEEGTYERTNNILIRTEQQLNDTEGLLLKYKGKEQEEVRKALQEARKEMEIARKEMRETRKVLIEKRKALQLDRAKQIEERNKIKDERAKQRAEWNKVKEEIKKAKEEN